jgi:RNA polymerase sigma-70 factor (sigma-E family)
MGEEASMGRRAEAAEAEFTAYFAARFQRLRGLAYLLCGDWHRADDLAQLAFVRLASSWHRLRDPEAVDSYVRTCLLRSYLSEQRRAWRRRESATAEVPEMAGVPDTAEVTADRVTLMRALAQVPPRQRAVLVCRYYEGLDVATTAALLGCSEGTVKSQTARGLQGLRRVVGDVQGVAAANDQGELP